MSEDGHRVLLLSQWYPPEPVGQPVWIAQALIERGHDVRVLTGMPHYPSGDLHGGYRWWRGVDETRAGIQVRRRPEYPYHGRRSVGRLFNYGSFALGSSLRRSAWQRWADVVLVYGSPATAATAALLASRRGLPYVLLVQDVWPDSIFASGFLTGAGERRLYRALDAYVQATYRRAAAVVVTSPGMVDLLAGRGVPRSKLHLVPNWAPERAAATGADGPELHAEHRLVLRAKLGAAPNDVVLLYAGNHGPAQGLDVVLRAMTRAPDNLHLLLVGDGVDKPRLVALADELGLRRTHFWDPRDAATLDRLRRRCDAALVSLLDAPLFHVTTPSKLQAAMAAGDAVVALCGGDVADIVRSAGAGLAADPSDPGAVDTALAALAAADPALRAAWGSAAREHYQRHLSEAVGSERLSAVLGRCRPIH